MKNSMVVLATALLLLASTSAARPQRKLLQNGGMMMPPMNMTTMPPMNMTMMPPKSMTTMPPKSMTTMPPMDMSMMPPMNMTMMPSMEDMVHIKVAIELFKLAGIANLTNSTILVPTDEAFSELPVKVGNLTDLFNSTLAQTSAEIFNLHIIPGIINSTMLPIGNTTAATATNYTITVLKDEEGDDDLELFIPAMNATVRVVKRDIPFGDNIVHVIDTVLLPMAVPPVEGEHGVMIPEKNETYTEGTMGSRSPSRSPTGGLGAR